MKNKFWIKLQAVVLCLAMLIGSFMLNSLMVWADDVFVDADDLDDNYFVPIKASLGYEIDPNKDYEIVESTLFNEAGQEVWDLAKIGKIKVKAQQTVSGHSVVKFTTDSNSKGGEVFFHNEKSPELINNNKSEGKRTSLGRLFPGYKATEYKGIRIYLNKAKTNQIVTLQVMSGYMFKGYYPSDSVGFYTYELRLPKKAFDGYIYLPFEDFKNKTGAQLSTDDPNFIAFKYAVSTPTETDIYVGELGLWREGDGGIKNTGNLNIGIGEELKSGGEYMFYTSRLFNKAKARDWADAKLSGFTATPEYTENGYYPNDAQGSLKLSTTAASANPEAFFWEQSPDGSSKSKGILFSKDINITDYDGIRIWVKAEANNPYSLVTLMIGTKAYYQSEEKGGYYSYNLVIDDGFEGYVNIPFENFVNLKGESLPVDNFTYIAFKHAENAYVESYIYFSNLQVYGLKANDTFKDKQVGAKIDSSKKYEIVESTLFNKAGQEVWDLTKIGKITVNAQQSINKHKAVKLTTSDSARGGEIYFWNEMSPALPEENLDGRTPLGKLFTGYNATEYSGIRLYVNKGSTEQSITYQVLIGSMGKGYWPREKVGFFTYELRLPKGAFEGYVYLPFKDFVNLEGARPNMVSPNFIAFKYQLTSNEVIDTYFGELGLWREGKGGKVNTGNINIGIGETLSNNTEYMFYDSLMFNNSTQKEWKTAKLSGIEATAQYKEKGFYPSDAKSSLKLSTTGKSKYPEAFYWEQREDGSSASKGIIFGTNINITD